MSPLVVQGPVHTSSCYKVTSCDFVARAGVNDFVARRDFVASVWTSLNSTVDISSLSLETANIATVKALLSKV